MNQEASSERGRQPSNTNSTGGLKKRAEEEKEDIGRCIKGRSSIKGMKYLSH
jgi:hypothetical protein